MSDSQLSIKDASGRQFSLLNDDTSSSSSSSSSSKPEQKPLLKANTTNTKRKYHCTALGCNKSFTTSGHLARHNRIHTGEKNFHCLYPGCPSRFSRQDNMMQHYRTHLSQKARRQQQQQRLAHNNRQQHKKNQLHHHYHPYQTARDHMFPPLSHFQRRAEYQPGYAGTKPFPLEPMMLSKVGRPRRTLSVSSSDSSTTGSFFNSPPPTFHSPEMNYYQSAITLPSLKQHQFEPNSPPRKSLSNLLHLANIVSTFG